MNPTASVEIISFGIHPGQILLLANGHKHGTVGVPSNSNYVIFSRPFQNALLHYISFLDAMCRTCRVFPSEYVLEGPPEMTHNKPSYRNKKIIEEIPLVTVEQKDLVPNQGCLVYLYVFE